MNFRWLDFRESLRRTPFSFGLYFAMRIFRRNGEQDQDASFFIS